MVAIADLIAAGKEFGIFQFYLPFVITFAIFYALLAKAKIFGEDKRGKNINLLVSGVAALLVIGYTPVGTTLAEFLGAAFGGSMLALVTLLVSAMIIWMLFSILGLKTPTSKRYIMLFALLVIVLAIGVFISTGGGAIFPWIVFPDVSIPSVAVPAIPAIGITVQDLAIILLVVGTIALIWWMQKEK